MPWTHCDRSMQDDEVCPVCQITKAQWTIEFNLTRTFVITRRPLIKVELTNLDDEPVPSEVIEVVFPERSGRADVALDADGRHKVVATQPGLCTLTFPYWAEGEVVQRAEEEAQDEEAQDEEAQEEEAPAEATAGDPAASGERQAQPARFEVTTRRKTYRYQVVVPYLDIELLDPSDAPVPGQAFELVQGEETVVRGAVGDEGWSRVRGIEEGDYELRLPDVDRANWSRREPAADDEGADEAFDADEGDP